MTAEELRLLCTSRTLLGGAPDFIYLKLRAQRWHDGDTRTLAGTGSPTGLITGDAPGGGIVVRFKASEVLEWLDKKEGKLQ